MMIGIYLLKFNQITGDITPAYSILEVNDIKKMYKLSPDAKLCLLSETQLIDLCLI